MAAPVILAAFGARTGRRWLGADSRCVVPFTSFSENEVLPDGSRPPVWFALGEDRGMMARID